MTTATASTTNATAKCSVTTAGSSCVAMIQPPIAAWITKSGARPTASHAATLGTARACPPTRARARDHAPTTARAIDKPAETTASSRWKYSMRVWYSTRGTHEPKHVGQSGQPSPEPVARTTPPHAINSTVDAVVAMARVRNARLMSWDRSRPAAT